ncbi:MAG: hypothetical protein Q8M08_15710 [Bacteroidales bacterium]|nr:hypothetical protein [Bacteroidales bacterium]
MEEQLEIQRHFRSSQEKYVYYLISLCVSAIGFSIYITLNKTLSYIMLPLGLSILAWSLSIINGFKFIELILSILRVNNNYFEVLKGNNPISGTDPQKIKIGVEFLMEEMEKGGMIAKKRYQSQYVFFVIGMASFLVWHILELLIKT